MPSFVASLGLSAEEKLKKTKNKTTKKKNAVSLVSSYICRYRPRRPREYWSSGQKPFFRAAVPFRGTYHSNSERFLPKTGLKSCLERRLQLLLYGTLSSSSQTSLGKKKTNAPTSVVVAQHASLAGLFLPISALRDRLKKKKKAGRLLTLQAPRRPKGHRISVHSCCFF